MLSKINISLRYGLLRILALLRNIQKLFYYGRLLPFSAVKQLKVSNLRRVPKKIDPTGSRTHPIGNSLALVIDFHRAGEFVDEKLRDRWDQLMFIVFCVFENSFKFGNSRSSSPCDSIVRRQIRDGGSSSLVSIVKIAEKSFKEQVVLEFCK